MSNELTMDKELVELTNTLTLLYKQSEQSMDELGMHIDDTTYDTLIVSIPHLGKNSYRPGVVRKKIIDAVTEIYKECYKEFLKNNLIEIEQVKAKIREIL